MYRTIETILVDIPTIRPHQLSVTTMRTQTLVLVKITTTDGIVGWGEATTIGGLNYGEESPESVKANIDTYFAPLLTSVKDLNVAQTLKLIRKNINGNRFAKCAIQTALLDIQAKRLGVPLSEVLGGRLRNSLPVLWTLASGDTEKDIAEARKMIELKRHNTFKLKIGARPLQQDVDHVIAIKKALGADVSVRVDVNRAWSELECIHGIQQLQDGGIDLIEQPCAIQNTEALARLTLRFDVAIMADEALTGSPREYRILKNNGEAVFAVKIEKSGRMIQPCEVGKIAGFAG
ncbi:muconate/chloromuconate family cycloisomerase, partial [Acinetobacter baumannii]|uniref:muconate/chloromuconate family cycloisomerase n=1 Tax=Acinetobacter baumannii TaxID=470 RepID=UPI0026EE683E